jgi:hypothetical protein
MILILLFNERQYRKFDVKKENIMVFIIKHVAIKEDVNKFVRG